MEDSKVVCLGCSVGLFASPAHMAVCACNPSFGGWTQADPVSLAQTAMFSNRPSQKLRGSMMEEDARSPPLSSAGAHMGMCSCVQHTTHTHTHTGRDCKYIRNVLIPRG